jgi:hypothetical protein
MTYGKLNIFLRNSDCRLIKSCWRTDLVIKQCGNGEPLVEMDPTIIEQLKQRYSDYDHVEIHNYQGEVRIKLQPDDTMKQKFNHIEVDVPPGCYVIWTRVCYGDNEETNKVMAIVDCNKEVCVNLLLDRVEACGRGFVYPFGIRAIQMEVPLIEVGVAVNAVLRVANVDKEEFVKDLEIKARELKDNEEAKEYLIPTMRLLEIMKQPGPQPIKK